jgi:sugar phosphate isomerase/epimerase
VELAAAASANGFAALGINANQVDAAAVEAYRSDRLRCHEVLALVLSDDADAMDVAAESLAEAATTMHAEWVLTVFSSPLTPKTEKIIQRCAGAFANANVGMAVEFSPLGPVSSISDGLEIVEVGNHGGGRAGLMIDSWHFCFGPSTWEELAAVPLDQIAYIQFADALAAEPGTSLGRQTMNLRALPGQGVLELDRFASTLLDRGWEGTVSAEILSETLRVLPIHEIMKEIHETMARFWI